MNIRKTTRISKWQASLLALVMTVLMAGRIALANGLPPPTFDVEFNNAPGGRPYYVMLFSDAPDYQVDFYGVGIDGTIVDDEMLESTSIPGFLESYEDPDGLTPAPNPVIMCEGDTFNGFYVPYQNGNQYRIVIYWDDTGEYKITEVFELKRDGIRYAVDLSEEGEVISISDVSNERYIQRLLPGTLLRLGLTIAGEFIIALFFCFFKKRELLTVLITNVVTNSIAQMLSLFLFEIYFLAFIVIELIVIVSEFFIYRRFFDKSRSNGRIWAYTIVANLVTGSFSFVFAFIEALIAAMIR